MRRNDYILSDLQPSLHNHVSDHENRDEKYRMSKQPRKKLSEQLREERERLFGDLSKPPPRAMLSSTERGRKYRQLHPERYRDYARRRNQKHKEYKRKWQKEKRAKLGETELDQLLRETLGKS